MTQWSCMLPGQTVSALSGGRTCIEVPTARTMRVCVCVCLCRKLFTLI